MQRVHVGFVLKEQGDHRAVAAARRHRERRHARLREEVDRRSRLDDGLGDLKPFGRARRFHQGGHALAVLEVGVGAELEQRVHLWREWGEPQRAVLASIARD